MTYRLLSLVLVISTIIPSASSSVVKLFISLDNRFGVKCYKEKFAAQFNVTREAHQKYEDGSRTIPVDYLIKVSHKYHITMDWLCGCSENRNDTDLILSTVLALHKVFMISNKPIKFSDSTEKVPALYIDKTFAEYLIDINNLIVDNKFYDMKDYFPEMYAKVYEKHKNLLQKLFGDMKYEGDCDRFIEICKLEIIQR